jgi:hypothetical protein
MRWFVPRSAPPQTSAPRGAPPADAIAVTDVGVVFEAAKPKLAKIGQALDAGEAVREHLDAMGRALCAYAHLLPATRSGVYREPSGLVALALDTALFAARAATGHLFSAHSDSAAVRRDMEPRWRLTVAAAAMLRATHLPLRDCLVTGNTGGVWLPLLQPICQWHLHAKIAWYRVGWTGENTDFKTGSALSAIVFHHLIPTATQLYMAPQAGGYPLRAALEHIIDPYGTDVFGQVIDRAFTHAIEAYDNAHPSLAGERAVGRPIAKQLLGLIRECVSSDWRVNQPDGHVVYTTSACLLTWPRALESLSKRARAAGIDFGDSLHGLADLLGRAGYLTAENNALTGEYLRRIPSPMKPGRMIAGLALAHAELLWPDEEKRPAPITTKEPEPQAQSLPGSDSPQAPPETPLSQPDAESEPAAASEATPSAARAAELAAKQLIDDVGAMIIPSRAFSYGRAVPVVEIEKRYGVDVDALIDALKTAGALGRDPTRPTLTRLPIRFTDKGRAQLCILVTAGQSEAPEQETPTDA